MLAATPATTTRTLRTRRLISRRRRRIRWVRGVDGVRWRTWFGCRSELLKSTGRLEQLLAVDVCVARDGREIGVAEVFGDEARVAELLTEPGRRRVAERVRSDVLLESGALRGAPNDVGEDRLLQSSALESAEDRVGRPGAMGLAQPLQLTRETRWDWLPS